MIQKIKAKITIKNVLVSLLLAVELWLFIDILLTFTFGLKVRIFVFPIGLGVLFISLLFIPFKRYKLRVIVSIALPLVMILSAVLPYFVYDSFKTKSTYEAIPCSQTDFFSNKKVMIIVPHEDDDLNLTSGMIENYIECGSEIYPVFVTNGDHFGLGLERIKEAINCWNYIGVPESNVYFLGYGDGWDDHGTHIYNSKDDELRKSYIGKTETYGISNHPAYHNGNLYTNRNYKNDIKDLILKIKPDTIFISDYDSHSDHMAVSLVAESVLGEILKESSEYQPTVYKGFAYSTAWKAFDDFYSINALSSKEPNDPMIYRWDDRIRFPVNTKALSRSAFTTSVFRELSIYESQNANTHTARIVNGDKVFWQRRTDSLLYQSKVESSSGNTSLLGDFKILDSIDVNDINRDPFDGVWIPDVKDSKKEIKITFIEKTDITQIVLYDNPSPDDNILNAKISFDDGTSIETGALDKNGCATTINVNKTKVHSFTIKVLSNEGTQMGLTEIEAYKTPRQKTDEFIKLVDENEDFVYDYITEDDTIELALYSNLRVITNLAENDYSLSCNNEKITYDYIDGRIRVKCPKNESGYITITENATGLTDRVMISNLNGFKKMIYSFGQYLEDNYVFTANEKGNRKAQNIYEVTLKNLTIYRFFSRVKALVA